MRISTLLPLCALLLTVAAPSPLKAAETEKGCMEERSMALDADSGAVSILVETQAIRVVGAEGQTLKVFSLSGRLLMTVRIVSAEQRMERNLPKGCYIIKVGKVTRKVVL